jgi:hypothetical protein
MVMSRSHGLFSSLQPRFASRTRSERRPGRRPSGRCWAVERLDERLVLSAAWSDAPAVEPTDAGESVLVASFGPGVCQGLTTDPLGIQGDASAIADGPGDVTMAPPPVLRGIESDPFGVQQAGPAVTGDAGNDTVAQPPVLQGLSTDALGVQANADAICGGNGNDSFTLPVLRGLDSDPLSLLPGSPLNPAHVDQLCGGMDDDQLDGGADDDQ